MGRKQDLSLAEWEELGQKVCEARHLLSEVWRKAITTSPMKRRLITKLQQATDAIDEARSDGEDLMFAQHGDAATIRTFYRADVHESIR